MSASKTSKAKNAEVELKEQESICGIVMPISEIDGCSPDHWVDVKHILVESISNSGLESRLVSHGDEVGVIQKRIIQNLYTCPIVVCDVSAKNPNVMFELGMRLAFDKPTIVVKDDCTTFSFDTSPFEHLEYPRDLRCSSINIFKELLASKIISTLSRAEKDPAAVSFLNSFGQFKVATIEEKEISDSEYIMKSLDDLSQRFSRFEHERSYISASTGRRARPRAWYEVDVSEVVGMNSFFEFLESLDLIYQSEINDGRAVLKIAPRGVTSSTRWDQIREMIDQQVLESSSRK